MIRMPGESYRGPLPPVTDEIRALEQELRSYVQTLAGQIGERNLFRYEKLVKAAEFIRTAHADAGYKVRRQTYLVAGQACILWEKPSTLTFRV